MTDQTPDPQPGPHSQQDPHGSPHPYGQQNPYGQHNPYGQQNPSGPQNPYGQQNPYEPPNPYGAQQPYGPASMHYSTSPYVNTYAPQSRGLSITSMILGILSLMGGMMFLVPQIVGVVFGHIGLKREPAGRGFAIAGLIMNYLALLAFIGIIVFFVFVVAIADQADWSTPSPSPSDWQFGNPDGIETT